MSVSAEIAALDRALARAGADVTIIRTGSSSVPCRARVNGLTAESIRPGSSSSQGNYRAIMSPTPFPAGFLPLRTTDKILWNGQQRVITFAWPLPIGTAPVRIEVDFTG